MQNHFEGSLHGLFQVVERASVKNKKVYWLVQCLGCNHYYTLAADVIKKNTNGCQACDRRNRPKGIASLSWQGGKYIPAKFLSNVARGARRRGITCQITIAELDALWEKQNGRCAYTNRELTLINEGTASLDRIDSSQGYSPANVQFVHKTVNVMKWALPEDEFFQFIAEIYKWSIDDNRIHQEQLSVL